MTRKKAMADAKAQFDSMLEQELHAIEIHSNASQEKEKMNITELFINNPDEDFIDEAEELTRAKIDELTAASLSEWSPESGPTLSTINDTFIMIDTSQINNNIKEKNARKHDFLELNILSNLHSQTNNKKFKLSGSSSHFDSAPDFLLLFVWVVGVTVFIGSNWTVVTIILLFWFIVHIPGFIFSWVQLVGPNYPLTLVPDGTPFHQVTSNINQSNLEKHVTGNLGDFAIKFIITAFRGFVGLFEPPRLGFLFLFVSLNFKFLFSMSNMGHSCIEILGWITL
jgi:hypothetical protein